MFDFSEEEILTIKYIQECLPDYSIDIDPIDDHKAHILISLPIDTLYMTEDNYHDYESYCDNFDSVTDGLAGCAYDISGYDYWTINQNESNYAIVEVPLGSLVGKSDDELDKFLYQVDELCEKLLDLQTMTPEEVEARDNEEE